MLAFAVMITASVAIERARCYTCKAVGPLGRREGAIAHIGTLDRPGRRQHAVELALSLHRIYATHRPIVAAANEHVVNPDSRYRSSVHLRAKLRPQRRPILHLIELHHRVLRPLRIKDRLGLDTERSRGERQHEHGAIGNQAVQLGFGGGLVVVTGHSLDHGLLPLVERRLGQRVAERVDGAEERVRRAVVRGCHRNGHAAAALGVQAAGRPSVRGCHHHEADGHYEAS
mmetsp:Transcript_3148/g.6614  ORF Transcript_3148/g.6614 Transcript_3148/m.6614 type:complete len:229 (+) Transcript_3148:906-1592(+)